MKGFIGNIVIVIIALFALSLVFGVDIVQLLKHPALVGAFNAIWRAILAVLDLIFDVLRFIVGLISN